MAKERNKLARLERWIELPIEKLVKASWNYKEDDPSLIEKLVANMKRNGQIENIIVRELETGFYEIVNGNHRYDALKQLESTTAMCYNCGSITQAQAMRIAVETNETRFATDAVKLAGVVSDIMKEFELPELELTMPFTGEDLTKMLDLTSFDFNQFDRGRSTTEAGAPVSELTLKIKVTPEQLERWKTLQDVYQDKVEESKEGAIFDFAVNRALFELEQGNGTK